MPPGHVPTGGGQAYHPGSAGGVAWESPTGGFLGRWWESITAINFRTREFFAAAAHSDDGVPACTFSAFTSSLFGFLWGLLYMVIIIAFAGIFAAMFSSMGRGGAGMGAMFAGIGVVWGLIYVVLLTVMSAIFGFLGPWINGGILHLLLMIYGAVGQGKGYGHTVRVAGYAHSGTGLLAPVAIVPILGGLFLAGWGIKNVVVGIDEVHQCGIGKALLVVLTPVLVCCGCYLLIIIANVAIAAAA